MSVKAGTKPMRQLARRLKKGLTLEPDGKSKVRIVDEYGVPVRYPDGRVVSMPNSPCDRTSEDLERRLRRLGLLRG